MVKILGLDIPAGLENLFNSIFRPQGLNTLDFLTTQSPVKQKYAYALLALRSFFVMWQDLYNSFDSSRRSRWDAYWLTLPFGSHSGANGWPGSGYSAFVYLNAPRYKKGLDLLLDPPFGVELLQNIDFSEGANHWQLIRNCSIQSGHLVFVNPGPYYEGGLIWQSPINNISNGNPGMFVIEVDAEGIGKLNAQYPGNISLPFLGNWTGQREVKIISVPFSGFPWYTTCGLWGVGFPTNTRFVGNIYKFSIRFG
jgi:hypothetical protein